MKRLFASDYQEGAHEKILTALIQTQYEQLPGYGSDRYTESAKKRIQDACDCPEAEVVFLTGGTQTNQIVIDTMLAPYEGVLCADTGHIATHEAGAIEYTGHKVLPVAQRDGKIDIEALAKTIEAFYGDGNHEHMVFPGMVYISHPTEFGTLYTKSELLQLRALCDTWKLPLYLDGARLAYGLCAKGTDVTLPLLAKLCDVFYIGGTKCGALCGEAVVFSRNNQPSHFVTRVKQHGALLAKGWLTGLQFDVLFTDGLYKEIGQHAIELAEYLKAALTRKGCRFLLDSPTNQQFLIVENEFLANLTQRFGVSIWERVDETHTAIRLCTSWATKAEDVQALIDAF